MNRSQQRVGFMHGHMVYLKLPLKQIIMSKNNTKTSHSTKFMYKNDFKILLFVLDLQTSAVFRMSVFSDNLKTISGLVQTTLSNTYNILCLAIFWLRYPSKDYLSSLIVEQKVFLNILNIYVYI